MLIKKGLTANFFYLKNLKFEHRKIVHYTLLSSVILLQIVAIITWYNETRLSKAFDEMTAASKALKYTNRINNSLVRSQSYFNDYINNGNAVSLKKYAVALDEVYNLTDSLYLTSDKSEAFQKALKKRLQVEANSRILKSTIDSIINKQIEQYPKNPAQPFAFKKFDAKNILDNIKTDSYVKVDKAEKKGLLSRLSDAISGKVAVQKEYSKTVVKMKYKDKMTTAGIEQQMAHAIATTNKYYEEEFDDLKKAFLKLRKNDLKLMQLNNELLLLSQDMLSNYNGSKADNLQPLQDQYATHKTIRSYSIILMILLMLVVSIILFNFTRIAFAYEKRLTIAQEKIRQSLNFKNRITGMISHEIRSPLSIIAMYSKKATASAKDEALKETFRSIEFTTNSLLMLSNQILEYSKEDNRKLALKSKRMYLKAEIDQIINAMKPLAETRGNRLEAHSDIDDYCEVYSDAAKIHQLFYNIIGNANKFTENGLIKVDLNIEPLSGFELNLKVAISDNGMGITENDLKNIFESYYQGTVSEEVNDLGVGLGLNICKEIIELFEGEIHIESKEGQGTTVLFNLTLSQV